ncbi:WYL domain-containing protein [Falsihalocynthiibacter arcticus]|uniref:WYL domain-containing protein n=1 Tax=Falsihalocynthiibacter arcticus TaxID=1579316 RepID=UPI003002E27C
MATVSDTNLNKWQLDRREFIEHRIFWHGRVGLSDLTQVMGLSRAQASKDLNGYIKDHPDHLFYDKSARTYVLGPAFDAKYLKIDAGEYLSELLAVSRGIPVPKSEWIGDLPDIIAPTLPACGLDPFVIRRVLLACAQRRKLTITYQSMSLPDPMDRMIAPHAVAFDGFRWHTRAFCFNNLTFKDFVLSRVSDCRLEEIADVDPTEDADWVECITLRIAPHPGLSANQRHIIELDYGMTDGCVEMEVRKSLLFYNLKRLGLDTDPLARRPQDQQIVLTNADVVYAALGRTAP